MNRIKGFLSVASTAVLLSTSTVWAAGQNSVTLERNVATLMRDGVALRADIYRPAAEGRFPVLLQRTPYNKDGMVQIGLKGATKGYDVIVQDVRGRYT